MKKTSANRSGMPGPGEDETYREEQAARENPGSTDTSGIIGKKGAVNSCTSSGSKGTCVMNTQQKGAGTGGENPTTSRCTEEPGARLSTKTPFMSTELPEVGVTPLGRGCWNKEGSQ